MTLRIGKKSEGENFHLTCNTDYSKIVKKAAKLFII